MKTGATPFALLVSLLLVGAGCSGSPSNSRPQPASSDTEAQQQEMTTAVPSDAGQVADDDGHAVSGDHLAVLAGSRIALDGRNAFRPGRVEFRFKLYGLDGHDFGPNDLKVIHEKKMHLLMVRDDMTGYQHLHPERADGKWVVTADVAEAGDYQLYVDIEPVEEKPVVLRVPVSIGGKSSVKAFPVPNDDLSAEAEGYRVTLAADDLRTQATVPLAFAITKSGRPVSDIDKYLGAYGHVVSLRHDDFDDFYHVHPLDDARPVDGTVRFETTFPVRGRYTLYAQFNVGGAVRTFPITVDVTKVGVPTGASGNGGSH